MTDENTPDRWQPARPTVHSVAVELTAFCNQKCDYCYNAWREDGGASVGTESTARLLARLTRVLDAVRLDHVTLTGGEPLASHDLFPVLDLLRSRAVRAQMISNAALVTDAIAARLARYRLRSVLVTLNGPDAATHEAVVGDGGNFTATVAGIGRLRRHRVPVEGSVVITRRNAARVGETVRLFQSLGVGHIALSRFSPAGYAAGRGTDLLPSVDDVALALAQASAAVEGAGTELFATMPVPPCVLPHEQFPRVQFHHCPIGTAEHEFALGPRGELRLCPLHPGAVPGARDLLDPAVDVAAVFAAPEVTRYRDAVPAHCASCAHRAACIGGCGAAAAWSLGDRLAGPDPFVRDGAGKAARRTLPVVG